MLFQTSRLMLVVLVAAASCASAQTLIISASKDNTLYEDPLGAFSNGAGQRMFAGTTNGGALRRAVIAFNIASSVPSGTIITSVSLRLNMSKTIAGPSNVELHRLTSDWGEGTSDATLNEGGGAPSTIGDATWIHTFFDTAFWIAPGGDFASTVSAATTVDLVGLYTWGSTPEMIADVQLWLDQPAQNFGWIIIGDETAPTTAKRFDTRTFVSPANRPALTVTYAFPQAPSINAISDAATTCGVSFVSINPTLNQGFPTPQWSLTLGPAGMTIDPNTGAVAWPNPIPSLLPYLITVTAANLAGTDSKSWNLAVTPGDFDGNGQRDTIDLPAFVDHLLGLAADHVCAADVNLDSQINGADVRAFVEGI